MKYRLNLNKQRADLLFSTSTIESFKADVYPRDLLLSSPYCESYLFSQHNFNIPYIDVVFFSTLYQSATYIIDLIDDSAPDYIHMKIQLHYIQTLYLLLEKLGIIPGSTPVEDQAQAYKNLIEFILFQSNSAYENNLINKEILLQDSSVIVLNIGSAGNETQLYPNFAKNMLDPVKILNVDQVFNTQAINTTDKIDNNILHFFRARFPLKHYCGYTFTTIKEKDFTHNLTKELRQEYTSSFIARKTNDPNFRLVLAYYCSIYFPDEIKDIAQNLIDSGKFTLGKDLEVVHAYRQYSSAVIYKDLQSIPEYSSFLHDEFAINEPIFTDEMEIFPCLNDVDVLKNQSHSCIESIRKTLNNYV